MEKYRHRPGEVHGQFVLQRSLTGQARPISLIRSQRNDLAPVPEPIELRMTEWPLDLPAASVSFSDAIGRCRSDFRKG